MYACKHQHQLVVSVLLAAQADVHKESTKKWTPLMVTVCRPIVQNSFHHSSFSYLHPPQGLINLPTVVYVLL
jgi:hypothetical protein